MSNRLGSIDVPEGKLTDVERAGLQYQRPALASMGGVVVASVVAVWTDDGVCAVVVKVSVGKSLVRKQPGGVRIAVWFQLQNLTRDGAKCRIRNYESREAAHGIKITAATWMIHCVKTATWWGCCTQKKLNGQTLSRGRCVDETWVTLVVLYAHQKRNCWSRRGCVERKRVTPIVLNAQLNVRHVMRVRCVDGDESHRSCCMHKKKIQKKTNPSVTCGMCRKKKRVTPVVLWALITVRHALGDVWGSRFNYGKLERNGWACHTCYTFCLGPGRPSRVYTAISSRSSSSP